MNVRTELNEKRKIVENVVKNNRAKMNHSVLENFTNMPHEMPNTKHANFMAKTNGNKLQKESSGDTHAGKVSPFESLKYY